MKTKEIPMPPKLRSTYMEPLSAEEVEMLFRMVCLGVNSGDPNVRLKLYTKVQKAHENAKLGRAWICTRDIIEMQKANGKTKERV